MLVASQVMLSIVLPFVIAPLVYLTSQNQVMMVQNGGQGGETSNLTTNGAMDESAQAFSELLVSRHAPTGGLLSDDTSCRPPSPGSGSDRMQHVTGVTPSLTDNLRSVCSSTFNLIRHGSITRPTKPDCNGQKSRSFKSHWSATAFGYALCAVVTIANAYVLLMLMIGKS
jgi:metal iron transporter